MSNWKTICIGDACEVVGGGTPSKSNSKYFGGDICWATVRDMHSDILSDTETHITEEGLKNSSSNLIPSGNVIIATRVGLGKVCISACDTAINQDLRGIIPKNKKFLPRFLFWYFKSVSETIIAEGTGATVQGVKLPFIKSLLIPNISIIEQKQIVAILDEAFEAIDKAKVNIEKNIENAKELFHGILNSMMRGDSLNWESKTLGEVCTLYQGIAINAKTKKSLVEKSELPLLRIKDLKNNTVEQYIDPNNYPKNALVQKDDLIYTRTGSLGLVFRGFYGVLHNNSFKVEPNNEITKDYLFLWLQSPIFYNKIISLAGRAAQPDITHALFKEQIITFPKSKKMQGEMVKKLTLVSAETERMNKIYQNKLSRLIELKKSILQKAFVGELIKEKIEA